MSTTTPAVPAQPADRPSGTGITTVTGRTDTRRTAGTRRRGVVSSTGDLALSGVGDLVFSGMLGFAATITLIATFATFAGLSVIGVGLVLLVAWVFVASWVVQAHRWKARELYGIETARDWREPPPHARRPGLGGFLARTWDRFKDGELWRGLGRVAAGGIIGVLMLGIVGWALERSIVSVVALARGYTGVPFLGWILSPWAVILLGVLMLAVAFGGTLLFASISRSMDAEMLGAVTRAEYSERIHSLEGARTGAVSAAEDQRVRIERDLHDGVQPQLVNVAMTIDLARRALGHDPEQAAALLDEAHSSSKEAITSLRHTVRGIHPAVLTDRGLDAALSALAARSTVPVDLAVDLPDRPSPDAEAAIYFVVAEALNNVTKHSHASAARVNVRPVPQDESRLRVVVSDDGAGGATLSAGEQHTGLRGMRDRLTAVGGTLAVTSPDGGPTTIVGELPCAS